MEKDESKKAPKFSIEKSSINDAKEIQEVRYQTWLKTYPNKKEGITAKDIKERFKNRFSQESIQKTKEKILDSSGKYLFLVAKEGDKIISICELAKKDADNELQSIYVLPDYQGRGIGSMFWRKALEFFGREKDVIVSVATYNTNAINFYKKLGFTDTGKRITDGYIPEMEMIIKFKK